MKTAFLLLLLFILPSFSQTVQDPLGIMAILADSSSRKELYKELSINAPVYFSESDIPKSRMNQTYQTNAFSKSRLFYGMSLDYLLDGNKRNLFTWHFILPKKERDALTARIQNSETRILTSKVFTRIELFESDSDLVVFGTESTVIDTLFHLIVSNNAARKLSGPTRK